MIRTTLASASSQNVALGKGMNHEASTALKEGLPESGADAGTAPVSFLVLQLPTLPLTSRPR